MQTVPPAPRPVADDYALRLLSTDAWAIAAFVFLILGIPFTFLGIALALTLAVGPIGLPFVALGLLFLIGGVLVLLTRYQKVQKITEAIRNGEAAPGTIVQVGKIMYIRAGTRRPSRVRYEFLVDGRLYTGETRTFGVPGPDIQPGEQTNVLYLPQEPKWNVMYPQP